MKFDWNKSIEKNVDFEAWLKENKLLPNLLELIGEESKNKYLNFLREMYDKRIYFDEFYKYESNEIVEARVLLNRAIDEQQYKDKEIVIE